MSASAADMAPEARREYIGGSDAGAVLGLNPYRSAVDVWLEKTGRAEPFTGNAATHWGTRLEDVIASEYAERTGYRVRRRNNAFVSESRPWLRGHIDRSVDGQSMVFEAKTAGAWSRSQWGADGTDEIPDSYMAQLAVYMHLTGYDRADLAVLIGGQDFRCYHIERNEALERLMLERLDRFWDFVQRDEPPPPSSHKDLLALHAADNGEIIAATPSILDAVSRYDEHRAEAKAHERKAAEAREQIEAFMLYATDLVDDYGETVVTWRKAADSVRVDPRVLKAKYPDAYAACCKPVAGARRFIRK